MYSREEILQIMFKLRAGVPFGADTLFTRGCFCDLCVKIRLLIEEHGMITSGGWADPRRGYLEQEDEFLKRVPDGFIRWPKDH